jgi:hypothetical protein
MGTNVEWLELSSQDIPVFGSGSSGHPGQVSGRSRNPCLPLLSAVTQTETHNLASK